VAAHFGRDVTTVRRWERREGLPVHRLFHEKLGSIYGFTDELDAWWAARTARERAPEARNPTDEPAGSITESSGATTDAEPDEEVRRSDRLPSRRALAAAAVLASVTVFLGVTRGPGALETWRNAGNGPIATAVPTATAGVVVLPFVNAAAEPDLESYFTDGMTMAVTAELAAFRSLKVIAQTSAKRHRPRDGRPLPTVARDLGVDWVLQGSVGRSGDRVRIDLELTRAGGERPIWIKRFERPIAGVLELQADIARAVLAQMLGPDAVSRETRRERRDAAIDVRAYELFLRGEFHTEQLNPVSLARAADYYTQAVANDPGFAPAWAGLAQANFLQEHWGNARIGERAGEVRRATLKALALDPSNAEAHDVMGRIFLIYDRDWAAAEAAFRKAIAEAPSFPDAYNGYSILLQALVRTDEALGAAAKARELDPMAAWAWAEEGRAFYRARRYSEAEDRYKRAVALDPGFAPAVDRLVQLYLLQRRIPEARRALDQLERLPSARGGRDSRAWLEAVEGNGAAARRAAAGLAHSHRVLIALGDYDAAIADLERSAADGTLSGFTLANPELDPIRRDPRFARIVAGLGLPVDRLVALGR
jgi:TolB-like protein/tetratricopeptide (TPR) repeat protein